LNDECILERPDGSRVAVLVNVVPHKDEHGRVTGAVSCMLDITERRRIEGLAKARERETKAVVDNSPDPIVRYSRELVRTYVNPAFVRVHGAPQEALLGKKIGSPEPAALEASEHLQTSLQSVLATGRPLEIEVIWPSPAGPRCYAVHLEPELDSRGQPESVLCISRNITERKRAEEALRESQRLLQQVLATLPVGVIVTARNGDIIFVNTASKRIWGGETIAEGRERWDRSVGYWHETGNKIEAADWASVRALNNGQTSLNELIDIESYNGQQKTILNSAAPIRNAGGQITGAVVVNEDVTERKKRDDKLRETEAELARVARLTMMGELAATIAHEVNQPLAAVVTNANAVLRWLAGEPPNLAEAREAARRIDRDAVRASAVIQRIRTFTKRGTPSRTSLDLNDLVRETLSLTQPELGRNKVTLETELAANLPPTLVDRVQVQQVLLNLIVNALDSLKTVSGRPRVLRLTTKHAEPDEVEVTVQDTGAGINGPDCDRLFEPFYSTKSDGLGMGLAISRSIVESHGGHLTATPNPGPGATFQFGLPIDRPSPT
jgi:PAS domain S-box-containing protein